VPLSSFHVIARLNSKCSGRFNLVDTLHDLAMAVTIHGDDVLAHANWEIGENWLRKYGCAFLPVVFPHLTQPAGAAANSSSNRR
jgi:hypothetical protein